MILLLGVMLFAQENPGQKRLLKRAVENIKLIRTQPEKAFQEAKKIENEAKRIDAEEAEYWALMTQCTYYKTINDFENLMIIANLLFDKAKSHKLFVYQSIAKCYLFEAYTFSDLPEKGFLQLEDGMNIIKNADENDTLTIRTKTNLFMGYANYFSLKKDYTNQFKYIKLADGEFKKIPEGSLKQKFLYVQYSHLANFYNATDRIDSAEYYARLAISNDKRYNRSDIQFDNYSVLGRTAMKRKDYKKALSYFNEAEKIKGYKNHINVEILYDNIIESYDKLNEKEGVKLYKSKQDSLKLAVAENQKKSLHNLLDEKDNDRYKNTFIYITVFVFIMLIFIIFWVVRKNKFLSNQEKISQIYLAEISGNPKGEDYSRLLKALKENDPAFTFYFDETFPEFSSKLLRINPEISASEVEFCALLKLKIPTKDIACYKFIAPKTVLNKKYLIRNKLNIPPTIDIYQWFDEF